ncbi:aspartyl-phosphate phosphatase Spo0E family protein [Cohnella caldifontis]|uniref:aspartyl-phosphate phosphatase Spo0E family protein n=1 Tax=Cohnella caldifontis TaxID=3027471 RepID=UPI0023EDFC59|nr:aspartyl-phosphate phosphatase Spo0E family protein [Cohnella sp. YIM B05605]
MDAAERCENAPALQSDAHAVFNPHRMDDKLARPKPGARLTDDIDDLRQRMAETFLREASFTADPVILISRQLDVKINEYMMQWKVKHMKAR